MQKRYAALDEDITFVYGVGSTKKNAINHAIRNGVKKISSLQLMTCTSELYEACKNKEGRYLKSIRIIRTEDHIDVNPAMYFSYQMQMNGKQLKILIEVLDFYIRLGLGQFNALSSVLLKLFHRPSYTVSYEEIREGVYVIVHVNANNYRGLCFGVVESRFGNSLNTWNVKIPSLNMVTTVEKSAILQVLDVSDGFKLFGIDSEDDVATQVDALKKAIFPFFSNTTAFGIGANELHDDVKNAHDLLKTFQKLIADSENFPENSTWKSGPVLHLGTESLPSTSYSKKESIG